MQNITKTLASLVLGLTLALIPLASASAAISLAVQSVSPSTTVAPGTTLTFTVVASGFSTPTFRVIDSFSSFTTATIDSSGNFRWTPTSNEIGTHIFTITVTDNVGNVATVQEQILVSNSGSSSNNPLSIQSLFPSSAVNPGQQVLFTAVASGFTNPIYSVSDTFSGSSVRSNFINSNGNFNWTPQIQDIGTHTITVFATDSFGRSASTNITITVSGNSNTGSTNILNLFPGSTVNVGQQVTFSVSNTGLVNPFYTISDARSGSSISSFNINSSGFFSWTPNFNDVGTHPITITVRDSFNNFRTAQVTLTVCNCTNNTGTIFTGNQTTIDILTVQLESLKAQLAALLNSGSVFNNNFSNFGNPTATVPVAGTGSGSFIDGFGNFGNNFLTGPLGVGSTGSQVTSLQIRLSNLGFFSGPITGFYGPLTQTAVLNFQASRGLPQTGFADSFTLQLLSGF